MPVAKPEVVVAALVVKGNVPPASQVNVLPLAIVATNTCPKLSSDQSPGSSCTVDATVASPQSEKFVASVTAVPSE